VTSRQAQARPRDPGDSERNRRILPLGLAAGVLLADQLSKQWVGAHLRVGVVKPFLPGLLELHSVRNTGAAFSLFSGSTEALGLVSLLVSAALLAWILLAPPRGIWLTLAVSFLLGGAAGNGIDRWRHGAVIDFLAFVPVSFPVFNLADVAINLAVACLLLDQLLPLLRPSTPSLRSPRDGNRPDRHG